MDKSASPKSTVTGGLATPQTEDGRRAREQIKRVGIIGAGQMGTGIAHVVSLSGYDVTVADIARERFDLLLANTDKNMARQVAKGKITEADKVTAIKRISFAAKTDDLAHCDLVIEA